MTRLALALALVVMGCGLARGGEVVTIPNGCTVEELEALLRDVVEAYEIWPSTSHRMITSEYVTPAEQLRRQAARIDRQDAVALRVKDALRRCDEQREYLKRLEGK